MNKSPLRYPGGKTRACSILETIIKNEFNLNEIKVLISPFFGGGSFEFYFQNKYKAHIIANDMFIPLYNFWNTCKNNPNELIEQLINHHKDINKQYFYELKQKIINEHIALNQASYFFVLNRCSFSGSTLSGGFSRDACQNRFTLSSINKIKKLTLSEFTISNEDFEEFIIKQTKQTIQTNVLNNRNTLMFLDPPYYIKQNLYGNNGDLHKDFNHTRLFNCLNNYCKHIPWMMTYNNCDYIRDLYKDFKMIETGWSYGMNKTKQSSELIIINPCKSL